MRWSRSRPDPPPRRPDWLTARPYAHRGLHGPGMPENSLAAFEAAIAAGLGIELDVRACRSGAAIVFHDEGLGRLTGEKGPLRRRDAGELAAIRLNGSEERIPSLADALALIAGRTPLLIEIKARRIGWRALCRSVARQLDGYSGPAAVMSLQPAALGWFADHAPHLLRGLVASAEGRRKFLPLKELALRAARPDFLAYDLRSLPSRFTERARARGLAVLCWTVRSDADRIDALRHCDQIIHELPGGTR